MLVYCAKSKSWGRLFEFKSVKNKTTVVHPDRERNIFRLALVKPLDTPLLDGDCEIVDGASGFINW